MTPEDVGDRFRVLSVTTLEMALTFVIAGLTTSDTDLVVVDSLNLLPYGLDGQAGRSQTLMSWLPLLQYELSRHPDVGVLFTWRLSQHGSGGLGPMALHKASQVHLRAQKVKGSSGDTLVTVTKDGRNERNDPPSCLIRWTGRGCLEDVRIVNEALDRSKIPSRFEREVLL